MASLMLPNYIFGKFSDITPEFLKTLGIDALLVDIDNTLASYEEATPNERVLKWVFDMKESGISIALISNNDASRVDEFNRELSLLAFPKCGKPLPKNLRKAMELLGAKNERTAIIGDQLLTDAAGGNNLKLVTIIVPPINDRNSAFFRFKRALEVPVIKKYVKSHKEAREASSFWLDGKYKRKNRK